MTVSRGGYLLLERKNILRVVFALCTGVHNALCYSYDTDRWYSTVSTKLSCTVGPERATEKRVS